MQSAEDLELDADADTDTDEHDPFGGATPVGEDQDPTRSPQRPSRRPPWYWIGVAVLAASLATGAFIGMRAAANHATTTTNTPANGGPAGPGQFGPPGGPGFGPQR